ncbi:hypothetical protein T484DRAFT_1919739, partial [Baffinella frigidus]
MDRGGGEREALEELLECVGDALCKAPPDSFSPHAPPLLPGRPLTPRPKGVLRAISMAALAFSEAGGASGGGAGSDSAGRLELLRERLLMQLGRVMSLASPPPPRTAPSAASAFPAPGGGASPPSSRRASSPSAAGGRAGGGGQGLTLDARSMRDLALALAAWPLPASGTPREGEVVGFEPAPAEGGAEE